jgi:hypothetical protein
MLIDLDPNLTQVIVSCVVVVVVVYIWLVVVFGIAPIEQLSLLLLLLLLLLFGAKMKRNPANEFLNVWPWILCAIPSVRTTYPTRVVAS